MCLAADGQDGNGLQSEIFIKVKRFNSCFHASSKKIDINGHGLSSFCELKLYIPLGVQR